MSDLLTSVVLPVKGKDGKSSFRKLKSDNLRNVDARSSFISEAWAKAIKALRTKKQQEEGEKQ